MRSASPRGQCKSVSLGENKEGIGEPPPPVDKCTSFIGPFGEDPTETGLPGPFPPYSHIPHPVGSTTGGVMGETGYLWQSEKREHGHIKVNFTDLQTPTSLAHSHCLIKMGVD